jgi:hypothetical protein
MPQEYVNRLTPKYLLKAKREKERPMGLVNLWRTLTVPRQFMNHLMMQVTADLYSIYLVLFLHTDVDEDYDAYTPDFAARGSYNNRHCAIRLNSNMIYEPLLPLVASPATYCLPRITFKDNPVRGEKTRPYGEKDDRYHPWLCDFLGVPVPEPLIPKNVVAAADDESLERVLWMNLAQTKWSNTIYLRSHRSE